MEKVTFSDFQNCVSLTNDEIEIIVTTDFGPRVLGYRFIGGENILGIHHAAKVETALGEFKPYGGHRLWIAPENMPNSYAPDNSPVEFFFDERENSLRLVQPIEPVTKTQKEITVTLAESGSGVSLKHKIINCGTKTIEASAWALTVMRGGGVCEIPNEPFAPYGSETLLPVRNLTVWAYTDLSDARWSFDRQAIRLRVDESKPEPQKIGILNKQGWAKYHSENLVFTKEFDFQEDNIYPDMNSNTELYTAGSFVEIESLAPLQKIEPSESIEHIERWTLRYAS